MSVFIKEKISLGYCIVISLGFLLFRISLLFKLKAVCYVGNVSWHQCLHMIDVDDVMFTHFLAMILSNAWQEKVLYRRN